jgi:hypothetical protein
MYAVRNKGPVGLISRYLTRRLEACLDSGVAAMGKWGDEQGPSTSNLRFRDARPADSVSLEERRKSLDVVIVRVKGSRLRLLTS